MPSRRLPYDSTLVPRARALRKRMSRTERRLWRCLRGGRMHGVRVHRQYIIAPFIVDFYCPAADLVIEVDGFSHDDPARIRADLQRDRALRRLGLRVLRVSVREVLAERDAVLEQIEAAVRAGVAAKGGSLTPRERSDRRLGGTES